MSDSIIVAVIGAAPALIVAIIGIVSNTKLVGYKIDVLEKKVEKHNQVIERTYKLESDMATSWKRYDDMADRIERLEQRG